jgi:hypothetical protein
MTSDDTCPRWCTADHSLYVDEDTYVHVGADKRLTDHVTVRLVASRHQQTGAMDGPYLLVDCPLLGLIAHELHVGQARHIGEALIALTAEATPDAAILPLQESRD